MADRSHQQRRLSLFLCTAASLLLVLFSQDAEHKQRLERDDLESAEIPAEYIDPAAIDLTPLVNTLINSSQSGSRQLFSLLSVTSYSSLALHKLTLLVYNISSVKSVESSAFRRRFCYCVTNETNDLTDFTAILLDVMGNSTTYLQEIFKSASILSVSQRNHSDCIYICVMAGKMGRELPDLWEVGAIMPLFNQTIVEGPHNGNVSSFRIPFEWHQLPTNVSHSSPSGMSTMLTSRVHSTDPETVGTTAKITAAQLQATDQQPTTSRPLSPTAGDVPMTTPKAIETLTTSILQPLTTSAQPITTAFVTTAAPPTPVTTPTTTASTKPTTFSPGDSRTPLVTATPRPTTSTVGTTVAGRTIGSTSKRTTNGSSSVSVVPEKPGCPWRRSGLIDSSDVGGGGSTISARKLQPCLFELCKFFSQCLCRPLKTPYRMRLKRYCDDSHLWYEKHTLEVCRRVRRVSFSRNLKQRCLVKMCNKL